MIESNLPGGPPYIVAVSDNLFLILDKDGPLATSDDVRDEVRVERLVADANLVHDDTPYLTNTTWTNQPRIVRCTPGPEHSSVTYVAVVASFSAATFVLGWVLCLAEELTKKKYGDSVVRHRYPQTTMFDTTLRLLRKKAGLTLREVAAATGVDTGSLARYEHGLEAHLTKVLKLAKFYGVPVEEIWHLKETTNGGHSETGEGEATGN